MHARGQYRCDPLPLDHERAGIHKGQVLASGTGHRGDLVARGLADGNGLAGQERFVDREVRAGQDRSISRDPVAFAQDNDISPRHLASGNTMLLPVANDQGTRARQVAEGLEGALGLALLVERYPDDHEHKAEQHDRFPQVTENKVDRPADDEKQEHRFPHHVKRNGKDAALL